MVYGHKFGSKKTSIYCPFKEASRNWLASEAGDKLEESQLSAIKVF